MGHFQMLTGMRVSVAEPPLFWAAPAPDVRGPGADQAKKAAPALGKKGWLQAAPATDTNIFNFSSDLFYDLNRPLVTLAILIRPCGSSVTSAVLL